jgi:hypothetical protein
VTPPDGECQIPCNTGRVSLLDIDVMGGPQAGVTVRVDQELEAVGAVHWTEPSRQCGGVTDPLERASAFGARSVPSTTIGSAESTVESSPSMVH